MNTESDAVDTLFDLLSNERRRHLCSYLAETDGGVFSFEGLVEQILKRESKTETEFEEDRTRVVADLYHTHLPKMADVGLVEYDTRSGAVRYGDSPITKLYERYLSHGGTTTFGRSD